MINLHLFQNALVSDLDSLDGGGGDLDGLPSLPNLPSGGQSTVQPVSLTSVGRAKQLQRQLSRSPSISMMANFEDEINDLKREVVYLQQQVGVLMVKVLNGFFDRQAPS